MVMSEQALRKKSRLLSRIRIWARKVDLENKTAFVLFLGLMASGAVAYALFNGAEPLSPTPNNLKILVLLITIILLLLATLVVRQIIQLWNTGLKGAAATRLHKRIVTLFSVVAITPTIIVAIFSVMFFEFGLQAWFSEKVQTVLDSSESVAKTYIEEHYKIIRADVIGMANELNRQAFVFAQQPELLDQALNIQARALGLSEAIIINRKGVITARASSTFSVFDGRLNKTIIDAAAEGGVKFFPPRDNDGQIRVILRLDGFLDQFLYISRLVDAQALTLIRRTGDAKNDFEQSQSELSEYRLLFNICFIGIALIVLFGAAWMGLELANKLMKPINILVRATDRVGKGDFSVRAPIKEGYDDLGGLTKAFNTMTWQLQKQQKDLLSANLKLDERRRFTETVLSGVSPGIMGLDPKGNITLPNRSASIMLGLSEEELKGHNINDVMPEVSELFDKIVKTKNQGVETQIVLERGENRLNLLVRLTAELKGRRAEGFVISFDDITEQVAAERTAAWADVARRIAHEIKNPLTPIQLSAERLKRKYLKEIETEPEIFLQCTDTIIRQVRDLRQMVDEFSSFARMPSPVIQPEDLVKITAQTTFMMDVSSKKIKITTDFPDHPVVFNCDAGQIGQALTNIIKNASEALVDQKDGEIKIKLKESDETIEIIVSDNGIGMPEQMMDRLTEPYVTTRAKGTGLGLAIVKKIMKDHGGDLSLENNDGRGAKSTLIFKKDIKQEKDLESAAKEPVKSKSNLRIVHGA
ncbi:MAG: PAS domain-containing sensor histidine kinase [Alphaproteobacteria bacterium]|nr:PAS domain-containing sensor histidine kinase [Alphaproteobacteria bacterium]HPF46273.1 PAS domain-containing sensor histidine kinase [Emcibacteraceae bacterium]